ncbi:DUF3987 domain-containing protein [Marinobacter nauticus]|uniref:DUF3987 domain-containing protein n=1 Tax=Marinobacter nauticus TaxID=2743 RepID=UPI001C9A009A|nr:DUF3987 domain-containing protein [Marinobacter nauticus]MBY5938090.1 DUF3987 domain-containing protein [Marinobacter nauticus]MBY5955319.1 DUF3987 domain-containing protein [Marinobacter nauticus]MBY6009110.1 DUF3987 domain-containing protein [Marinobacter nauticus]
MTSPKTEKVRHLYYDHLQNEPPKPRGRQTIYDDTTVQGLLKGMHQNTKNVCVLADEGTGTLNQLVTPGMSALNSSWSGMPIKVERKTSESFTLSGQRMAFLLSIQPGPFQEYRDRKSDLAKAAGLWARTLVCGPLSTIGFRQISRDKKSSAEPAQYFTRIRELIEKSLSYEGGLTTKNLLKLSDRAADLFVAISNEIEVNMRPGGIYANATDHGSKLMENIVRVAGILHAGNNENGDISYETLDAAVHICVFFSNEYMMVFDHTPSHVVNAMILNDWLTSNVRSRNQRYIPKRHTRQYCPSAVRKPAQFRDALEYLECSGHIRVFVDEKNRHLIDTMPNLPA